MGSNGKVKGHTNFPVDVFTQLMHCTRVRDDTIYIHHSEMKSTEGTSWGSQS